MIGSKISTTKQLGLALLALLLISAFVYFFGIAKDSNGCNPYLEKYCELNKSCYRPSGETSCVTEYVAVVNEIGYDQNGCNARKGQVWCPTLNSCILPWRTTCPK